MPRRWRWLVLLAATSALAACDAVTTVHMVGGADYSAGRYVQTGAQNGTNAVVVRNSPFPAEAVLAAIRARYQGDQYRFALGTPSDWNGYTVILGFGGQPPGDRTLCDDPNLPQPPSPHGVVELVANYCYGNRLVTEALSRAPALTGPRFLGNYVNQPAAALSSRIRTSMPLDMPGSLGLQASADLTAAILAANNYPAGDTEIPSSSSAQQALTIDPVK